MTATMKNFDSRVYSLNDIMEWHRNEQLVLNPRFQRRSVWTENAKSYLMDTIVRGKPIPKIFMRQILNTTTKKSVREVVDGQQRLRTIISFLEDGFKINPKHNSEFGGVYFSQLSEIDDTIQATILNYEIAVDLLVNMPDGEILDVFGRLNSYSVVLNEQEKLNANHFGPFKTLCDKLAHKYDAFWTSNRILSENQALRMQDVSLVADLVIAMTEGIKFKMLKRYFDIYEESFPYDVVELESQFDNTLLVITEILEGRLKTSEFRRSYMFYSLFCAVYHGLYGLKNFDQPRANLDTSLHSRIRASLEIVDALLDLDQPNMAKNEEQKRFIEDSRAATTNADRRTRRAEFLNRLLIV